MNYTRLTKTNANYEEFIERVTGHKMSYLEYTMKAQKGEKVEMSWATLLYMLKMHNRLAELEDKIEQGTLIELKDRKPLMWGKDGDTIHCQHCGEDLMGVFNGETEVIQCPQCGGFVYGLVAEDYNEAILKELQNGNNT